MVAPDGSSATHSCRLDGSTQNVPELSWDLLPTCFKAVPLR
jgi:hypothetical protein